MIKFFNFSEGQEDSFLISIEDEDINILVDGGNGKTDITEKLKKNNITKIDYIVLTHIDQDHIKGIITLLEKEDFNDFIIVYNKFTDGNISFKQAERFEKIIEKYECIVSYKDYQESKGKIIFLGVDQRKLLRKNDFDIYVTFFSPNKGTVKDLYDKYKNITSTVDIINKSSIMFLLEYKNVSVLMTGDGYISDILANLNKLADENIAFSPIKKISLIKIPHHGSERNNEYLNDLLEKIKCEKFIITNKFINLKNTDVQIKEKLMKVIEGKSIYSSTDIDKYKYKDKDNQEYEIKIVSKEIVELCEDDK